MRLVMLAWAVVTLPLLATRPGVAAEIDFDDLAPGTPVGEISGVGFSENVPGYALAVVSRFETSSGQNGLGIADGGFEVLFPGDVITLDFATPVESLEIRFVSSPNTPAGVFSIASTTGVATSGTSPDQVLADQGEVFSVSLEPAGPFEQAVITAGEGLYSFNLDDIRFVPEPAVGVALLHGAALLLLLRRTRRRPRSARRRLS